MQNCLKKHTYMRIHSFRSCPIENLTVELEIRSIELGMSLKLKNSWPYIRRWGRMMGMFDQSQQWHHIIPAVRL